MCVIVNWIVRDRSICLLPLINAFKKADSRIENHRSEYAVERNQFDALIFRTCLICYSIAIIILHFEFNI